jgi:hypothetical protein
MSDKLLVSAAEAAELLGISERHFNRLRKTVGIASPVDLGIRVTRYHRAEIEAFARSLPYAKKNIAAEG